MAELNSSAPKTGGAHKRKKINARVDLTAMVDLAFLLITFFMLTTTLSKSKAMDLAMPDKTDEISEPIPASRSFTICLGKNNQLVWYLGELKNPEIAPTLSSFGKDGIRKALLETSKLVYDKTGKSMIVLVKPSNQSVYNNLVNTLDELNITHIPSYAIVDIDGSDTDMLKQKGIY
ncbi:ExbD/TolR family protein [Mucilaginibacter sp. SP1R1]|uniref:ExbD/TolR family protein n=1 Tax=Mucilaginibacter sp. SP1R1 TaxID=2723091 RepID=UPI00160E1C9A|nr:biopolymer transporter ExbD [Mucilaginibacter sp. SP1R1]MBB6151886.1 biopolymer transport protein ExbD [Mucilaginibacter sp. SP1R1]